MITDKDKIKIEIESWLGTSWKHGIALKGWGADCIQFIVAVSKNLGWLPKDYKTILYKRDWALHNSHSVLEEELSKVAKKINIDKNTIDWNNLDITFQVGDVFTFIFGKCASHTGIYIGNGIMIHCYIEDKVRRDWVKKYRNRFSTAWRII